MGVPLLIAAVSLLPTLSHAVFPNCTHGPLASNDVCNSDLSPKARAAALVEELTVDEKTANLRNDGPGVPRLGLPPYPWWNEVLHGFAFSLPSFFTPSTGNFNHATSFPQPINLGASFDDELVYEVAAVISTESRAFSNANYTGLDFFTPNINPFKDPRWGRGPETPGEDPFHGQSYARSYISGLEGGEDSIYKKTLATCKHHAAYDLEDWNGIDRFHFNAEVTTQDLVEYYLPAFKTCARDMKVASIMCSYNEVNGVPACASEYLLQTVLREHWDWNDDGNYVAADCGAVSWVFEGHEYTDTPVEVAADALNAGTDVDCVRYRYETEEFESYYSDYLGAALDQGLVTEEAIDRAVIRLFSALVNVGYFDDPDSQIYRSISWADVDTPHARNLAYDAAVEGTVLLKNDGLLPLRDRKGRVALIGPWANATTQMMGDYSTQNPTYLHGPLYAAEKMGLDVIHAQGTGINYTIPNGIANALEAARSADTVIFIGGIDNDIEMEQRDRVNITWPEQQLDLINQLNELGKPLILTQMGGGQVDSSDLVSRPTTNALLWSGYPGQDGGTALLDILFGEQSVAGRLPITQYPAAYVDAVPMTDMSLRPGPSNPGRTYKWYTGDPVFEFGFGLHYTNFSLEWSRSPKNATFDIADLVERAREEQHLDLAHFIDVDVEVTNIGDVQSDFVTLLFLSGEFGEAPYPAKSLVAYKRLKNIDPSASSVATLNLTLGSISRVAENGETVIYPGDYRLFVDIDSKISFDLTLTGESVVIEGWPEDVKNGTLG